MTIPVRSGRLKRGRGVRLCLALFRRTRGLVLAAPALLCACTAAQSSTPRSREEIPAKPDKTPVGDGRGQRHRVPAVATTITSQAPSPDAGQSRQECHALEWPDRIDRASRAFALATIAQGHSIKPEFGLSVARRAVSVADAEGDPLAQALAREAYGMTLARRASATKASLLPALKVLREALLRMRAAAGQEDRRVISVLLSLAWANKQHGTYAAAMEHYREALRVARKIDEKSPGCYPLAASVYGVVHTFCESGYEPACEFLKKGFRCYPGLTWDESCPERPGNAGATRKACGSVESGANPKRAGREWSLALEALEFVREGKLKEAEKYARAAVDLWRGSLRDLPVVETKIVLAHILFLQGEHKKALTELDEALKLAEQAETPSPELRANILLHRAAVRSATGKGAVDALTDVQSAFELCDTGEQGQTEFLQRLCAEGSSAACKLTS